MKKSKLKKQIKKLKNIIDDLYCNFADLSVETANQGIELNEYKAKFDELNTKVNSLQSQVNNSIQLQIEALLKYTQDQNNEIQAQINKLNAQKCECESSSIETIAKQVQSLEEKVYYLGEVTANFVEELRGKVKKLENHSCDTNQKAEFDKELFIDIFTKELIRECTCTVNGETMKDRLVNGESVKDIMTEIIAKANTVAVMTADMESYSNTQKTDNISTAGQDDGKLGQSVATCFDEISEVPKEFLDELGKTTTFLSGYRLYTDFKEGKWHKDELPKG